MTTWWQAVASLRAAREPGVLVTVTDVRGHAPRDAGAKMVVSATPTWASIGGGNLEAEAVRRARALLEAGADRPESFVAQLSDKAPFQHGVQCCGGEVSVLLEPLPVVPSVAIFGVGHVGLELARILARHDLDLHLVDSRPDHLSAEALAPLGRLRRGRARARRTRAARAGARRAAARHPGAGDDPRPRRGPRDLRRRDPVRPPRADRADRVVGQVDAVPAQLLAAGHDEAAVDRISSPIGLPGVTASKDPAAIAVSVAAELLAALERESAER